MNDSKIFKSGFTLIELIVSIAILGTLVAMALPTFVEIQTEAKGKMSIVQMVNIKQAFANHFYNSVLDNAGKEFPPEPADHLMTTMWAKDEILYNGRNVTELFSEKKIPYNPYGNPYYYELLDATDIEEQGFLLRDPQIGLEIEFRP